MALDLPALERPAKATSKPCCGNCLAFPHLSESVPVGKSDYLRSVLSWGCSLAGIMHVHAGLVNTCSISGDYLVI